MVSERVEASFPSNVERSVASALLSLSVRPSVRRSGADSYSPESLVSGSHDLKVKIVRKKRSKGIYISNLKKPRISKQKQTPPPTPCDAVSEITIEASSCFSSGSSSNTSTHHKPRKLAMPSHMGHRAAAIIRILSSGSTSEVTIRHVLGDSPSTSKALRILLKLQTVKRLGAGGRSDPYIYMMA